MPNILIVGLGNPGGEFKKTRHNLGWRAVEFWRQKTEDIDSEIHIYEPVVYMNESGVAVVALVKKNNIPDDRILVVHDDVELPFGEVKLKEAGSASGHNGVRSIQTALDTDKVMRLRIGIGRPTENDPLNDYVLRKFDFEQEKALLPILEKAAQKISEVVANWRQIRE